MTRYEAIVYCSSLSMPAPGFQQTRASTELTVDQFSALLRRIESANRLGQSLADAALAASKIAERIWKREALHRSYKRLPPFKLLTLKDQYVVKRFIAGGAPNKTALLRILPTLLTASSKIVTSDILTRVPLTVSSSDALLFKILLEQYQYWHKEVISYD